MDNKIQWAIKTLMDKVRPDFHGTFTMIFKEGTLQHIKTEETAKPPC